MAKELGAHHTLHVDTRDAEEMARRVEEALGCKPDVSIECSGTESGIQTGIYVSQAHSTISLTLLVLDLPLGKSSTRRWIFTVYLM